MQPASNEEIQGLKSVVQFAHDSTDEDGSPTYAYVDTEFTRVMGLSRGLLLTEVTFLDVNGNLLLSTFIAHQASWAELPEHLRPDGMKTTRKRVSSLVSGGAMSIQALAKRMLELGLNEETTFIQWGSYAIDSYILFDHFRRFHLGPVIDPQLHLVPMNRWRNLLPNCPSIALEFLYPTLFPKSQLVGQNHRSYPDTQMLYHLTALYCALQDSPGNRNLTRILGFGQDAEQDRNAEYDRDTEHDRDMKKVKHGNSYGIRQHPNTPFEQMHLLRQKRFTYHQKCWLLDAGESGASSGSMLKRFRAEWKLTCSLSTISVVLKREQGKVDLDAWRAGGKSKEPVKGNSLPPTIGDFVQIINLMKENTISVYKAVRHFLQQNPHKATKAETISSAIAKVESGKIDLRSLGITPGEGPPLVRPRDFWWTDEQVHRMFELKRLGKTDEENADILKKQYGTELKRAQVTNKRQNLKQKSSIEDR